MKNYVLSITVSLFYVTTRNAKPTLEDDIRSRVDSSYSTQEANCLNNLLQLLGDNFTVVTNSAIKINHVPVVNIDQRFNHPVSLHSRKLSYVFNLKNQKVLDAFAFHLTRGNFEPRALYIILVFTISETPFTLLAKNFVYRVYVVDDNFTVFTYSPYRYENIGYPELSYLELGNCNDPFQGTNYTKSVSAYPSKWRNTTLRVFYRIVKPFVFGNGNGFEELLVNEVVAHLGMKLNTRIEYHTFQGIVTANGTYQNKGLRMLSKKKCDLVIGAYHAYAQRNFDASVVYVIDTYHYVFPKSQLKSNWDRIYDISSPEAKMGLAITSVVWIAFVHLAYGESVGTLFKITFLVAINVVVPTIPTNKHKFKIALGFWILGNYVLSTLFTTRFQAIFCSQQFAKPMYSAEDLIESDLVILASNDTLASYVGKRATEDMMLYDRMQPCINRTECLLRVCRDRAAAFLASQVTTLFLAFENCVDFNSGELLIDLGEDLSWVFLQSFLLRGYPAYDAIDKTVKRLMLYGGVAVAEYKYRRAIFEAELAKRQRKLQSDDLSVEEMRFILLFWAGGLCVATLVFLLELYFYKYCFSNTVNSI
ncbi:uncharacterized protein LOC132700964 [Cylas formicarius]|uniref:uncharacterized protein LOC132700964 n=1 Tax=Cylas formicarius TaxID=197179 RepID=UPI002958BF59|nr:uncharacterized protein LOC132700964 [Cylas formicarius]